MPKHWKIIQPFSNTALDIGIYEEQWTHLALKMGYDCVSRVRVLDLASVTEG